MIQDYKVHIDLQWAVWYSAKSFIYYKVLSKGNFLKFENSFTFTEKFQS